MKIELHGKKREILPGQEHEWVQIPLSLGKINHNKYDESALIRVLSCVSDWWEFYSDDENYVFQGFDTRGNPVSQNTHVIFWFIIHGLPLNEHTSDLTNQILNGNMSKQRVCKAYEVIKDYFEADYEFNTNP